MKEGGGAWEEAASSLEPRAEVGVKGPVWGTDNSRAEAVPQAVGIAMQRP